MIMWPCPPIFTYPPIHIRKIDMTIKNSGGFIRSPSLFREDDAMLRTRKYSVIIQCKANKTKASVATFKAQINKANR